MKIKNVLMLWMASLWMNHVLAQGELPAKAEDIAPLLIGETIPAENLVNMEGKTVSLADIVKEKPTVLIIYRGGWCPYCNMHLAELSAIEADIIKAGYQIIAISPDEVQHLAQTDEKKQISYQLFSDSNGRVAKALGIAFQVPAHYEKVIKNASGEVNTSFLPVPSVFVVNTKGEIMFEYISPNFKQRLGGKLLLSVLQHLDR
jgi:peroxiredoxin